jgi:hypothetical protein
MTTLLSLTASVDANARPRRRGQRRYFAVITDIDIADV